MTRLSRTEQTILDFFRTSSVLPAARLRQRVELLSRVSRENRLAFVAGGRVDAPSSMRDAMVEAIARDMRRVWCSYANPRSAYPDRINWRRMAGEWLHQLSE